MTLAQAARYCGGTYRGPGEALGNMIRGIATDNRRVEPGYLFVALRGERFDGHDFIPAAYEAGAACCLTERALAAELPQILVRDTLEAVQALAEAYKAQFPVTTVGITGSVGKTTTKEMIAGVLGQRFRVCKSQGNFNNQLGVPLTLFQLAQGDEVAVVEMGTNHFGEIRNLARMARPDLCVLTNIGISHIEHLGSREGILRAKCEMLEYLRPGGRVFVNGDDDLLRTLREGRGDVTSFGLSPANDIYADGLEARGLEGTAFTAHFEGQTAVFFVPAPGEHMVYNALAALAAGRACGMEVAEIRRGIAAYAPISGRMCIEKRDGLTVLNDVYNANPGSMMAAIDVMGYAQGRKVCVLGDMLELGPEGPRYHREVGRHAGERGMDLVLCVGPLARSLYEGVRECGGEAQHVAAQEELLAALPGLVRPGDTILVKASRGMHLEHTVNRLLGRD